jgi:hypothetical protein
LVASWNLNQERHASGRRLHLQGLPGLHTRGDSHVELRLWLSHGDGHNNILLWLLLLLLLCLPCILYRCMLRLFSATAEVRATRDCSDGQRQQDEKRYQYGFDIVFVARFIVTDQAVVHRTLVEIVACVVGAAPVVTERL